LARFANSVMFTPVSTGTVDFVVSAAVSGFMTPALAGAPTGVYKYRAESLDLTQWEIGEGTYTSGTVTLTRTTVLYNSSGTGSAAGQSGAGSKINFTSAPRVGIVQTVEDTLGVDQANSFSTTQKAQARSNLGAIPLTISDTAPSSPAVGDLWWESDSGSLFVYYNDGSTSQWVPAGTAGTITVPRGHLSGLVMSTAGSSTTFTVAPGEAADSTNVDIMRLAGSLSKTTSAWAVGSGNGGLDTGTILTNNWYHVFLIKRPDTGVVDVLYSLSTSPTMPANYTLKRRIGSVVTNGSSQWWPFVQHADTFLFTTPILTINADATIGTTPALKSASVPPGVIVEAILSVTGTNSAGNCALTVSAPMAPWTNATPNPSHTLFSNGAASFAVGVVRMFTNTSAQLYYSFGAAANNTLYVATQGWVDRRGRDD
jgi:hypothetical protein